MAGDAYFEKVSLLLHGDGLDGSTVVTDSSFAPRIITPVGTKISTVQSQFGGSSLRFNGSTDYLRTPNSPNFDPLAGDFTVEAWVYLTATPATGVYSTICSNITPATSQGWRMLIDSNRKFTGLSAYWSSTGPSTVTAASAVIPLNTFTHVAYSRIGTALYGFVSGALDSVQTIGAGTRIVAASVPFDIGRNDGGTWMFSGYIDELRITNGVGRYVASFTPQTSAFPDYAGRVSGVVRDDTGTPCARAVRAYRRDTGALVGAVTSDVSTGIYTINCPTLDEVSRVVLDDAAGTLYNDLIDRVIPA